MTHTSTLPPGLVAVTGGERSGKTSYLRQLAAPPAQPLQAPPTPPADTLWLDLALPGLDGQTPPQVWAGMQTGCPHWNAPLHAQLLQALKLQEHVEKKLFMLSTGSRRKVALAGLLASGATVTCLDPPYAALDQASIRVLRSFLQDMADHPSRSWVVADYEADPELPWRQVIALD